MQPYLGNSFENAFIVSPVVNMRPYPTAQPPSIPLLGSARVPRGSGAGRVFIQTTVNEVFMLEGCSMA